MASGPPSVGCVTPALAPSRRAAARPPGVVSPTYLVMQSLPRQMPPAIEEWPRPWPRRRMETTDDAHAEAAAMRVLSDWPF